MILKLQFTEEVVTLHIQIILVDPILVSVNIVQALQSIISRNVDPLESGVLSITKMNIGTANNVISNSGDIVGTIRAFQPAVRSMMISRLRGNC